MDIRQLRYFLVIAEEGQISRAAKRLHMAQPPLSQQLRLMEEELDVTLIERKRNGKSMKLTEPGEVLYQKAQVVLDLFEESMLEVKETSAGTRGTLSIGVVPSCVSYLPNKVKTFNEAYPAVSFKVLAGDPYDLREQLESRTIELALVRFPMEKKGLATLPFGKGPFVFVVPKTWQAFHAKDAISMKEVEDIPLVLIHRTKGEGVYEMVIEECKRFGIKPTIVCESTDVHILLSFVASGIGASIIPKSSVPPNLQEEINVLDISDTSLESETALVWLEDRYLSKAASRFLEFF